MRKWFAYGGIAASVILIAFGIGAIVIGVNGYNDVRDEIAAQKITATPDAAEITGGKLTARRADHDGRRREGVRRRHGAPHARGDERAVLRRDGSLPDRERRGDERRGGWRPRRPQGQPVENGPRNLWVTETALSTALNTSFFAERVAVFSIVMGVALLLTGIGFFILTLGGALGYVARAEAEQEDADSVGRDLDAHAATGQRAGHPSPLAVSSRRQWSNE